jgi:cbb3-type cytochrome oxidase subunit 3
MTWFLFAGDMIVMLLMCVLVVWVYMKSTAESAQAAARIPLEDEYSDE